MSLMSSVGFEFGVAGDLNHCVRKVTHVGYSVQFGARALERPLFVCGGQA
ncbi:hypothetical protein GX645_02200 [Candidatus Sumerlaeota bacterium]|nr:hypothetical protein [Candidatus Sumerlaeota bacterium]